MADHARIDDLRRRLEKDPASIAFAQLAEEYRRAGDCDAAVRVCEAGLADHPAYVSARVTLGRALLELGRIEDARVEFTRVLEAAPDNQAALTALAAIDRRTRDLRNGNMAAGSTVPSEPLPQPAGQPRPDDRILAELEAWLDAITEMRDGGGR